MLQKYGYARESWNRLATVRRYKWVKLCLCDQLLIKQAFGCIQHRVLLWCSQWVSRDFCSHRGNGVVLGSRASAVPVLCTSLLKYGLPPCCFLLFTSAHDCFYLPWISFHLCRIFFSNKINLGKWKAVGKKYLFFEDTVSGFRETL